MRAGVIATVDDDFEYLDSYADTVQEGSHDLDRALDVKRVFSLPDGRSAFEGVAAREGRRRREVAAIERDGVTVSTETRTETIHTRVAGVPGEFVVTASSSGAFAFDLVASETGVPVERVTLDLDGVLDATDGGRPWRAGIAGSEDGVNGVFHGEDLRGREDVDRLRADGTLNQLGLEYDHGGSDLKMTATRSGYVEVYQPSSFDTGEFLTYVGEQIIPHTRE